MTPELKQLLTRNRAMHRSGSIRRWLALALLAVTLPLAALAWMDDAMVLDRPWRWLGFVIFAGAVLWALLEIRRALTIPGEPEIASVLDAHSSLVKSHAIATSVQLDAPRTGLAEEVDLLARLHVEAGKLASAAAVRHPGPRAWQTAGAVCGVLLLGSAVGLHGSRPVMRMLMPWSEMPYTSITLAGPERNPLANEVFTVSGVVSGRVPQAVNLQMTNGPAVPVPVAPDGSYRHVFENGVAAPVALIARGAADGVSPTLPIELRAIPQALDYAHRILPPAYVGEPERIETRGSFTVLRASKIGYVAIFDLAPAAARIVFEHDLEPVELQADPGHSSKWGGELPQLRRSCGYHIEVAEADGIYRVSGEPQQIIVTPDKPPVVEVLSNNGEELKTREETFKMNFDASDDIGMADVRVLYRRVGDEEQKEIEIPMTTARAIQQGGVWELPLTELKAEPRDMVAIVVQVRDANNIDGPGIGNSEPIIIEIPEDASEDEDQQAGGGGGGGGGPEQINPLEIQQQLYRETLRLSLGRKSAPQAELRQRQLDNAKHLAEMAEDPSQEEFGEEYLALLKAAGKSAAEAAKSLRRTYHGNPFEQPLASEAETIDSLLKAARIAENAPKAPPGGGEGGMEGAGGPPPKQFSLTKSSSPKSQPMSEQEQKEMIEQALADIEKALKEQEEINEEVAENESKGKEQEGEESQGGSSPGGKSQGGKPQSGQGPSSGGQSSASASMAGRQGQASAASDRIREQMKALSKSANGADPALAAEQLRQASEFQAQAAEAMAKGMGSAEAPGESSVAALRKAHDLTRSLFGETAVGAVEPGEQALEYQHLIQEYTRRLSYDD